MISTSPATGHSPQSKLRDELAQARRALDNASATFAAVCRAYSGHGLERAMRDEAGAAVDSAVVEVGRLEALVGALPAPRRRRATKGWCCQECGYRTTAAGAARAYNGDGCPKCGGSDFDLAVQA